LLQPGLSGLGQDDSGGVAPTIDTSYSGELIPYDVPPGYGYGPSESGGVAVYPVTSGNPVAMPATTQSYQVSSSGVMPVLNNPALSYLSTGAAVPTGSVASSSSLLYWLLGGAALVGVVLLSGGKRR
jgi:hypothetical protein